MVDRVDRGNLARPPHLQVSHLVGGSVDMVDRVDRGNLARPPHLQVIPLVGGSVDRVDRVIWTVHHIYRSVLLYGQGGQG